MDLVGFRPWSLRPQEIAAVVPACRTRSSYSLERLHRLHILSGYRHRVAGLVTPEVYFLSSLYSMVALVQLIVSGVRVCE